MKHRGLYCYWLLWGLIVSTVSVGYSFRLPGWLRIVGLRSSVRRSPVNNEFCISNLPPWCNSKLLTHLLNQNNISFASDVSVVSYGTSDKRKYASVLCEDNTALSTYKLLRKIKIGNQSLEVSVMPQVASIRMNLNTSDACNRDTLLKIARKNDIDVKFSLDFAVVSCGYPALLCKVLHSLSSVNWNGPAKIKRDQGIITIIKIYNIGPTVTRDEFQIMLNKTTNSQYTSFIFSPASNVNSTKGHATVTFADQEQVDRAVEVLHGYPLHDTPLIADQAFKLSFTRTKCRMVLRNLPDDALLSDIETLCADTIGGDRSRIINVFRKRGDLLSFCRVEFLDVRDRNKCMDAMQGHYWRGRILSAAPALDEENKLSIPNFPAMLHKDEALKVLQKHLGPELPVQAIAYEDRSSVGHRLQKVQVSFFSRKQMKEAQRKLNKVVLCGLRLLAVEDLVIKDTNEHRYRRSYHINNVAAAPSKQQLQ